MSQKPKPYTHSGVIGGSQFTTVQQLNYYDVSLYFYDLDLYSMQKIPSVLQTYSSGPATSHRVSLSPALAGFLPLLVDVTPSLNLLWRGLSLPF